MPPVNTKPNIEITLIGLVMAFPDAEDKTCSVGLLRDAPEGHALTVEIKKMEADGGSTPVATLEQVGLTDQLDLTVSNTSISGMSRRKMDVNINRKVGPLPANRDSFRWVVDFESEIYEKPIGAKKKGFVSILTLNNGELLTRKISENDLIIHHGPDDPGTLFGRVATKTGIDIFLDQPNSRAVFKNGDNVIFEADNGSNYKIFVDRGCSDQPGNDADSYYTAVGDKLKPEEKIFFSSNELPPGTLVGPNDPDAKCLTGQMSRSTPT